MKKNFNIYLKYYLITLLFFGIFYLNLKHDVGNDSTISEWLINYAGGFTKRGLIGQFSINFANYLNLNLRDSILILQIFTLIVYFIALYIFMCDLKVNKIIVLAIFTPIFILYPVAEIEVLVRKETLVFCIYLFYFFLNSSSHRFYHKLFFLPLAVLIWEPVFFFFPFFLAIDIIKEKQTKININFAKIIASYVPVTFLVFYIAFNPLSISDHNIMSDYLMKNFNETCYMSCAFLGSKSTIYDQFKGNYNSYSLVVFFRYFLIILIGFTPLFLLAFNSSFKSNQIIFFKNFKNLLSPILLCLSPVILLFAMGSDWGRWVNISYVFSILFYLYLYKNNIIVLDESFLNKKFLSFLKYKKIFIVFFVIYCFGWNPKTQITGDVATKPGYQIPRKVIKIIYYKYLKN
tara:strand:- start:675 stop:1886 length:1212 start_codon:yes stop_codon:yes gene_type:complete